MINEDVILESLNLDYTPSKFQMDFYINLLNNKSNILLNAVAGSGKTTTIVDGLKLLDNSSTKIFLAFNNSVVEELKFRTPSDVVVTTLHSLGWRSIIRVYNGAILDKNKAYKYCEKILRFVVKKEDKPIKFKMYTDVIHLMRNTLIFEKKKLNKELKRHDIFFNDLDFENLFLVWNSFKEDNNTFDFTDMLYKACTDSRIRIMRYDFVFVDEVQDLNRAQQKLVERLIHKRTKLITVGDPRQSIYGFAGSDSRSFKYYKKRKNTIELPLSITYRCPKNIAKEAKKLNKKLQWSESSSDGVFNDKSSISKIRSGDWVLCRNVKPLVVLCVDLISKGYKARIKGSTDFAKQVIYKLKGTKKELTKDAVNKLIGDLDSLYRELLGKGIKKPKRHPKYIKMSEILSVIYFLSSGTTNVKQIIVKLERLFTNSKSNDITLSTIHKSKGLENDRIFIICPELIPSKYAIQKWQLKQENNLKYVAYTRAKKELHICNDFEDSVVDFRKIAKEIEKQYKNKKI